MSIYDQADGFYESPWFCGKCGPAVECMCTLKSNGTTHLGRIVEHTKDVWDLTHAKASFRLTKGFNLLNASER